MPCFSSAEYECTDCWLAGWLAAVYLLVVVIAVRWIVGCRGRQRWYYATGGHVDGRVWRAEGMEMEMPPSQHVWSIEAIAVTCAFCS